MAIPSVTPNGIVGIASMHACVECNLMSRFVDDRRHVEQRILDTFANIGNGPRGLFYSGSRDVIHRHSVRSQRVVAVRSSETRSPIFQGRSSRTPVWF